MLRLAQKSPYLFQLVLAFITGFVLCLVYALAHLSRSGLTMPSGEDLYAITVLGPLAWIAVSLLGVYPWILLAYQLMLFGRTMAWSSPQRHRPGYDTWVIGFLFACQVVYLRGAKDVVFFARWREELVNSERHGPISPSYFGWIVVLVVLSLLAFYALSVKLVDELPPLIAVLAMAMLYIGTGYAVVWTIQIYEVRRLADLYLLIPALVVILIVARTIAITVRTYVPDDDRLGKLHTRPWLGRLHDLVVQAKTWPVLGFVLALPVLGVTYAILVLCGQGPHALIRAFTDTSEWALSQKTSPPNVSIDEHYLCTVAAGGHRKLVKPIRSGIRHGHPVIVNRQLLVANAFEQVISERLPRTHRIIRHLYDRYGFNLAKRITTSWAADIVWVAMKPWEWVFLTVIYLCERHPEDLIAMQYTGIHYRQLADLEK